VERKKKLGRRDFLKIGTFLAGAAALAACSPPVSETATAEPTLEGEVVKALATAILQVTSTPEVIVTKAPEVTPTPFAVIEGAGGPYTPEQNAAIEPWKKALEGYWPVWAAAGVVNPDRLKEGNIPLQPFWGTDGSVCVLVNEKYQYAEGQIADGFTIPVVNGRPQFTPPEKIEPGQSVLPLTITGTDLNRKGERYTYDLGCEKGLWVRRDHTSKEIEQRVSAQSPFPAVPWEAATLGLDPNDLSRVTDWDRQPMTAEAAARLAAKPDAELLASAPVVDTKLFYPDRPDIVSLVPAEVTRLDGGVTLIRYDTNVDKMVVTKTVKEPGGWWQIEARTINRTIAPEITKPLITQFGVIPEHPYGFSGNQFIDYWNLYVMAEKKDGQWTVPDDETKCGHMSPQDETLIASGGTDDVEQLIISYIARLSGNARWEKKVPLRDKIAPVVDVLVDDLVFRDNTHKLKILKKTRLHAIDPNFFEAENANYLYIAVPRKGSSCESPKKWQEMLGCFMYTGEAVNGEVEQKFESVYSKPGNKVYCEFKYQPGPLYDYSIASTEASKASWGLYKLFYEAAQDHRADFKSLSDAMLDRTQKELFIPPEFVLTNAMTHIILTNDEYAALKEQLNN
jgi:hypothetical protein